MSSGAPARVVLALILVLTGSAPLAAQESVGLIARMAEVVAGGRDQQIRQPTAKVQLWRGGAGSWMNVAPRTGISLADTLRVARFVDAQVDINRTTHRGVLTFLPELLRRGGEVVFPPAAVGERIDEGRYALGAPPERPADLRVAVRRGALIVDWVHGRLLVEAAGTPVLITGTRIAVAVDPEGASGLLYLETGSVTFPDFPEVTVRPGDILHLRAGHPPTRWAGGAIEPAAIQDAVRYHNREIWRGPTPAWRKPAVLIPATIAVGTVVACAILCPGDDPVGTVIIRFPPQ